MRDRLVITGGMLGIVLILFALFVTGQLAAQTAPILISLDGGTISHGGTLAMDITADGPFTNGFAGYSIRIGTADANIATPVLFTAPNFGLTDLDATSTPGTIRLAAVDLNELIQAGAVDVVLGTVTFQGISDGITAIGLTVEQMDDDNGFPVLTSGSTGLLTVTAAQDLDGDGLTEDWNDNGHFDFADIQAMFKDYLKTLP